jgi:hypothetical protein
MEDVSVALPNGSNLTIDNIVYSLAEDDVFQYTLTVNQPLYKLYRLLAGLNPAGYLMRVDSDFVIDFLTEPAGLYSGFCNKYRIEFSEMLYDYSSYYKISSGFSVKMRYGFENA